MFLPTLNTHTNDLFEKACKKEEPNTKNMMRSGK